MDETSCETRTLWDDKLTYLELGNSISRNGIQSHHGGEFFGGTSVSQRVSEDKRARQVCIVR